DRAPERILSLEGAPHSFTDVSVLADGRVVVLAATPNQVAVRELDGGRVLWHRDLEALPAEVEGSAAFAQDQVRVTRAEGWVYLDAATGEELVVRDWESMGRPCEGRHSAQLTLRKGVLTLSQEGQPDVALARDVTRYKPRCAVSPDGRRLAYRDTQDRVHLVSLPEGHRLAARQREGRAHLLFPSPRPTSRAQR